MATTPTPFGINPNIWTGINAVGTGIAGSVPTPTNVSGTSQTQGSSNATTTGTGSFSQWLQNFLQSQNTQTQTGTSTTSPNLTPGTQALLDQLTSRYQNLAAPSLTGYQGQQTQNINQNAGIQSQAVNNIMASRGLATSPAAATAAAGVEQNRLNNITQLGEQIPLLKNQLDLTNLGASSNFLATAPRGTTTTTGGTTTGTTSSQQNQGTGGQSFTGSNQNTSSASTTNQQQNTQSGGGFGDFLTGFLNTLAHFSDKTLKKDIKPLDKAIAKVNEIKPVSWKWKSNGESASGVLAQDLKKTYPDLVEKDGPTGLLKVNYGGLISTLISTINDLKSEAA